MIGQHKTQSPSCQLNQNIKLRRLWTKNQTQPMQVQITEIGSPHFKSEAENQAPKSTKSHFISSLITKIKSVERSEQNCTTPRQDQKKVVKKQATLEYEHSRGTYELPRPHIHYEKHPPKPQSRQKMNSFVSSLARDELWETRQQNTILKQKMNELIIENQKLKLRFKKSLIELEERQTNVKMWEERVKQRQKVLLQKESLLHISALDLSQETKILEKQSFHVSFSNLKLENSRHFELISTVEEIIFPTENGQLLKASQQIKQLKLEKLELEKKFISNIKLYRKKKQEEIQKMKRGFANNLNHYKELLFKLSTRNPPDMKKYQQDTLQTVILETSSADES